MMAKIDEMVEEFWDKYFGYMAHLRRITKKEAFADLQAIIEEASHGIELCEKCQTRWILCDCELNKIIEEARKENNGPASSR